jgi:hypothetical protein
MVFDSTFVFTISYGIGDVVELASTKGGQGYEIIAILVN